MDDIGASTKRFEVYSKRLPPFGNFLWIKYLPGFRAWGPYREMTALEWRQIFEVLEKYSAKVTVAVTAAWVERNGDLIPFPEKFPEEAECLKQGQSRGLIEIANHGLTHCVLKDRQFLPQWFGSNRKFHREFWDWIPDDDHFSHLRRSQEILQEYFGEGITSFVPPGNVFSQTTLEACVSSGIRLINCNNADKMVDSRLRIVGNDRVLAFHDREIVLFGVDWLRRTLDKISAGTEFIFTRDL